MWHFLAAYPCGFSPDFINNIQASSHQLWKLYLLKAFLVNYLATSSSFTEFYVDPTIPSYLLPEMCKLKTEKQSKQRKLEN